MPEQYARPEVLVETEWLGEHLQDPTVRIVEVSEDPTLYERGHIPGAVRFHWKTQLQDCTRRDWISKARLEALLGEHGIGNDTTIVLYSDQSNLFATYAFWLFTLYGVEHARVLNGGRAKWAEEGRALSTAVPAYPRATLRAGKQDPEVRAFRDQVLASLGRPAVAIVDVRSPQEYSGELIAMPAYPQEGAQRGGHVPGAQSVPWGRNMKEDGTFKSVEELTSIYRSKGITPNKEIVTYCRIGERSSLTWFTLKYLLGYPRVRNYDGSWTEWGSLVGVPIEKSV
jgi:thiosulfate/3-mercaptopyruvate sulfurtransferase